MANRFQVPAGSSSPPSTPDRFANRGSTASQLGDSTATLQPPGSTTPAGHPASSLPPAPSTAGSFTPAGAPSASFLGSSIMRGVSGGRGSGSGSGSGAPAQPNFMAAGGSAAPGRNLFAAQQERQRKQQQQQQQNQQQKGDVGKRNNNNTPLGRSIRGSKPAQPSRLVMTTAADEDEDEENDAAGGSGNGNGKKVNNRGGTFRMTYDESYDEDASERERDRRGGREDEDEEEEGDYGEDQEDEAVARSDDAGDDMWLDMSQGDDDNGDGDSDLMMHVTPAANERARREAESLFRMSAMQSGSRRREHKYAAVARDMYNQLGSAAVSEPPELVLGTEAQIGLLYDRGVGEADDAEKLDDTLAAVAAELAALWHDYASQLPHSDEEHSAEIGPGPHALPFEKAEYLANLALQIHHTRYDSDRRRMAPLPETLFRWLAENHNLYPDQVEEVLRHRPSPACHSLFWQTVFMALLRGNVGDAARMLREAGWGHFRRGATGQYAYTGQALENLQHAVDETCDMLETCPGFDGNWEIRGSDWTLFRVRAQGVLDQLRRFAEGKGPGDLGESVLFDGSVRGGTTPRAGGAGLAGLARKAQSQVPWDIYENLNVVLEIVLGSETAILDAAQDWCEATAGLFGWWDERRTGPGGERNRRSAASHLSASMSRSMSRSLSMSRSQALVLAPSSSSTTAIAAAAAPDAESYLDRLARSFHAAVESAFEVNALNQVEVGMACIFEDNAKGLIGILRAWSLPVAAAVAEVASLGKWLPSHRPAGLFGMEDLDMDDLEVLGMDRGAPDELDGIKDNTLVLYAHALVELPPLSSGFLPRRDAWRGEREGEGESESEGRTDAAAERDGWELAIHVLGRMDSPERSEEMIEELVRQLLEALNADSGPMVDKIWGLLNGLGMITFAEDTAEAYGDILARDSHRYGEAMWYYALAHRPDKVREVMNLLISYSLIQSTAYPPAAELDDYLRRLLGRRNSTLERLAQQDLEAAELLGKMLSGYAALRQFYDIRDGSDGSVDYGYANNSTGNSSKANSLSKAAAAAALISVIASADDNIRGGLYDQTRDGIVSEDFLLALLGEALVFVVATDRSRRSAHHYHPARGGDAAPPVISLPHIDTLLKAVEDLQAVGPRVYSAADEFLQLVLASAPGGAPTDLLDNSSSKNGKSGGGGGGNLVLSGRSVLKSQLQKRSVLGAAGAGAGASSSAVRKRGWDWRTELPPVLPAASAGEEIVRRLRLGLAQELGTLWLAEADGGLW